MANLKLSSWTGRENNFLCNVDNVAFRGSIWLGFPEWREFLDELVTKKGLNSDKIVAMLEECGRPSISNSTVRIRQIKIRNIQ